MNETLTFSIGESKIEESDDEKLLGAWVSNNLKWTHHLEKLESKFPELRLEFLKSILNS